MKRIFIHTFIDSWLPLRQCKRKNKTKKNLRKSIFYFTRSETIILKQDERPSFQTGAEILYKITKTIQVSEKRAGKQRK